MKVADVKLRSISPYSQSRFHDEPKKTGESGDAYEKRTWPKKMHLDENGVVFIPPMSIKKALDAQASRCNEPIPGKGKQTWAKKFKSGVLISDAISLGIKAGDVEGETLFMNAQGKAGIGGRVKRIFPRIPSWEASFTVYLIEDQITEEVFERYLAEAGQFVGVGRWRPEVGGMNGRFVVESVKWRSK